MMASGWGSFGTLVMHIHNRSQKMGGVLALAALVVIWSSEVETQDPSKLMVRTSILTVLATSKIVELHVVMLWAVHSPWQSYMW